AAAAKPARTGPGTVAAGAAEPAAATGGAAGGIGIDAPAVAADGSVIGECDALERDMPSGADEQPAAQPGAEKPGGKDPPAPIAAARDGVLDRQVFQPDVAGIHE